MKVTIVGMIYKSISYLDFMVEQLKKYGKSDIHEVDFLIIVNDGSEKILNYITNYKDINFLIYNDKNPNDYYLNRVYRAWNYGGMKASGDIIVFVNSDMAYTPNWLDSLLKKLTPQTIPCSRLVESGKLLSGQHAISKNFGRNVTEYHENSFLEYTSSISIDSVLDGGLYMPCAFYKKDFINSGGYPEGNICMGGIGAYKTHVIQSGDDYFFKNVLKDKIHCTVLNSIVYHIQEGELDE